MGVMVRAFTHYAVALLPWCRYTSPNKICMAPHRTHDTSVTATKTKTCRRRYLDHVGAAATNM